MTNEQLAILCKSDESYLPELWGAVKRLIHQWAIKYLPPDGANNRYDADDLAQAGFFGMLGAIKAYPEDCPHKFNTYLRYHCRNEFRSVAGIRSGKQKPPVLSLDAYLTSGDDINTTRHSGGREGS